LPFIRTPFGAFGGKLKKVSATDLGVASSRAALAEAKVNPSLVDETFFGNVIQSSTDSGYLSRHIALKCDTPVANPALTVNRLCGSGFESAALGTEAILSGRSSIVLTGGAENMSMSPLWIGGVDARWGVPLGAGLKAEDSLWAALTDSYAKMPMGMTAEKVAEKFGITREQCDDFGVRSQVLWAAASKAKLFDAETCSMEIKGKKGMETMTADEHPKPDTVLANLSKLRPVFKEGGVVTAGTASGICDGSASVVLASEAACTEHNMAPLARVVSWSRVGCDPTMMGIGPVPAIEKALKMANLTLGQMDLIEINEAFAAQSLACAKALDIDMNKFNLQGGALALGHPLGASGARILAHMTHELQRTGKRYAVGAACIGGGQGIAVILENPNPK
jgi:acetyl-CoA acyltransferase 2